MSYWTRKEGAGADGLFLTLLQVNIPACLCTSPISTEQIPEDVAQPSHGQETSTAETTSRKRRRRRRKPKQQEVPDLELEGCEDTKNEVSLEELCKPPAPR